MNYYVIAGQVRNDIIITNENKEITINDGTDSFNYNVPPESIVSYKWKK